MQVASLQIHGGTTEKNKTVEESEPAPCLGQDVRLLLPWTWPPLGLRPSTGTERHHWLSLFSSFWVGGFGTSGLRSPMSKCPLFKYIAYWICFCEEPRLVLRYIFIFYL